jgi:hypothetical protein
MKITFLTVALLASLITFGQEPVTWKITASRKTDSLYELVVKGNPAKGWHIYADIDTVEGLEPVILKWDWFYKKKNRNIPLLPPLSEILYLPISV